MTGARAPHVPVDPVIFNHVESPKPGSVSGVPQRGVEIACIPARIPLDTAAALL